MFLMIYKDKPKLLTFCSTGPRACIGRNLAYFEQQILLATLVHLYEFEMLSPDYELPVVERLNANPAQFWVRVRRRETKA
jgi:cytochrome P450